MNDYQEMGGEAFEAAAAALDDESDHRMDIAAEIELALSKKTHFLDDIPGWSGTGVLFADAERLALDAYWRGVERGRQDAREEIIRELEPWLLPAVDVLVALREQGETP